MVDGKQDLVDVDVADLHVLDLPRSGSINRKYYVVAEMDGQQQSTRVSERCSDPQWKEPLTFHALVPSTLKLQLYIHHRLKRNELLLESSLNITHIVSGERIENEVKFERGSGRITFTINVNAVEVKAALDQITILSAPEGPDLVRAVNAGESVYQKAQDAVNDWSPLLEKLDIFCNIMGNIAEVHPYAKMAWSILDGVYQVYKDQLDRDDRISALCQEINKLYDIVHELQTQRENHALPEIKAQDDLLPRITRQTVECCYFVRSYSTHSFVNKMLRGPFSNVDTQVEGYCSAFKALKEEFDTGVRVGTQLITIRILDKVESLETAVDLNDMPYAGGAFLGPEKMCLPGTRAVFLDKICDWINSSAEDTPRLMVISGAAGTGKSAIAHSVAQRFKALKRLGSSFGFDRSQKERTPEMLLPTIARDLADFDQGFRRALASVIGNDKAVRTTTDLELQFRSFIAGPVANLTIVGPIVIVVDALDESGNASRRRSLVSLLAKRVQDLPPNFRILVTSRPEGDIIPCFHDTAAVTLLRMDDIDKASTEKDVELYVRSVLTPLIGSGDLSEEHCARLAKICQGLFQWAFVACAYIGEEQPGMTVLERYERLVEKGVGAGTSGLLDALYMEILSQVFPSENEVIVTRFKVAMGLVLACFEPLSITSLNRILRESAAPGQQFDVGIILRFLGSLLSGVSTSSEEIHPLHTSFSDFLTDATRSGPFYVEGSAPHRSLALACLVIMQEELTFNYAGLESSHLFNKEMRTQPHIPAYLAYACRYWAQHLQSIIDAGIIPVDFDRLRSFLFNKFLFWLEILSVIGALPVAPDALSCIAHFSEEADIRSFAIDARKFVNVFGVAVSHSAPHIYLSALPFAPSTSMVSKLYRSLFPSLLQVNPAPENWPVAQMVIPTGWVSAVAVSPTSSYIAAASAEAKTITLWNMHTGNALEGAFEGHTDRVRAVVFSADGTLLASGSSDKTIRVWDVKTKESIGSSLAGHDDTVSALAFLSNNSQLVSGSSDATIRTWDISTGAQLLKWSAQTGPVHAVSCSPDGLYISSGGSDGVLRLWKAATGELITACQDENKHTDEIIGLAFSPDGTVIATASHDYSVGLWDSKSLAPICDRLVGHTDSVHAVTFSPNGKQLASGSRDNTVKLWDMNTARTQRSGNTASVTLSGHTNQVRFVGYSPSGEHVISAADDETIRIWDTEATIERSEGHEAEVSSLAFTPDSARLVSGSWDATIRVWDATTGRVVGSPMVGHSDGIMCISVSPDGTRIASASEDRTVRLWDMQTSMPIGEPLKHQSYANGVAFAPDGHSFVSCSEEDMFIWDAASGKRLDQQLDPVQDFKGTYVSFSPNSLYVAGGSATGAVRVWDATTGKVLLGPSEKHESQVNSISFSPDSKRLVSGSDDESIRLWGIVDGEVKAIGEPWDLHEDWVRCVTFSPDGKYVASGSDDKLVRFWDSNDGSPVGKPIRCNGGGVWSLVYTADGQHIASGTADGRIQLWKVSKPKETAKPGRQSILFSHCSEQALPRIDLIVGSDKSVYDDIEEHVYMKDDGWVVFRVDDGEKLLFWVPAEQRRTLKLPKLEYIAGLDSQKQTQLDLSQFVHGAEWTKCYRAV